MDTKGNKNGNEKQKRDLSRRPAREFTAGLSKDGKYWLLRDTTTWFIPVNYLEAIRKSHSEKRREASNSAPEQIQAVGGADDRSH